MRFQLHFNYKSESKRLCQDCLQPAVEEKKDVCVQCALRSSENVRSNVHRFYCLLNISGVVSFAAKENSSSEELSTTASASNLHCAKGISCFKTNKKDTVIESDKNRVIILL